MHFACCQMFWALFSMEIKCDVCVCDTSLALCNIHTCGRMCMFVCRHAWTYLVQILHWFHIFMDYSQYRFRFIEHINKITNFFVNFLKNYCSCALDLQILMAIRWSTFVYFFSVGLCIYMYMYFNQIHPIDKKYHLVSPSHHDPLVCRPSYGCAIIISLDGQTRHVIGLCLPVWDKIIWQWDNPDR
jgi:hypothetical protein